MNKKGKSQINKIIIAITIVMLLNFVMPNLCFASVEINGGIFFKPIAQFIAWLADVSIQALQTVAIGDGTMRVDQSEYVVRYSPAIIFSGKIPMFDINFINPKEDYKVKKMVPKIDEVYDTYKIEELVGTDVNFNDMLDIVMYKNSDNIIYNFYKEGSIKTKDGTVLREWFDGLDNYYNLMEDTNFLKTWEDENTGKSYSVYNYEEILSLLDIEVVDNNVKETGGSWSQKDVNNPGVWSVYLEGDFLYNGNSYDNVEVQQERREYYSVDDEGSWYEVFFEYIVVYFSNENYEQINPDNPPYIAKLTVNIGEPITEFLLVETEETIPSIANVFRSFVATWYKVFRVFALVALLVVLVYVAIRMILSSTSKSKAKYKKMLVAWVTAVCIIFVMQYIISLVFGVTGAITELFSASVVGEYEKDILMSDIRNKIGDNPQDFMSVFAQIVIYVVLVIFTILFTIQYLKRTIYMSFLTLISPLVAFTYPLDKLKDGKAQAFSAWLREFIFTALVQPVHLIVYCLLVNSAIDLSTEVPVYAIMIIGFLLPAEKFVKQMFGLNRADTIGSMAATFGGATIMNSIKKLGLNGPKGKKGGDASGKSGNSAPVRTVSEGQEDPYDVLREDSTGTSNIEGAISELNNLANLENQAQKTEKKNIKNNPKGGFGSGAWNVAKRYALNKNGAKSLFKGGARLAGGATFGTIGLAAGIATGDMENALAGTIGGITAGSRIGANLVDGGANLIDGISGGIKDIGDTYGEGAYGKDEYARMKFDKEFKKTEEYIKLINKYPGRENDVQQFLNAGITDVKMMQKAMDKNYNIREAIAYIRMAQAEDCPNEILYDRDKFKAYLEARDIPGYKAEEIRRGILQFK